MKKLLYYFGQWLTVRFCIHEKYEEVEVHDTFVSDAWFTVRRCTNCGEGEIL